MTDRRPTQRRQTGYRTYRAAPRPSYLRRRLVALGAFLAVVVAVVWGAWVLLGDGNTASTERRKPAGTSSSPAPSSAAAGVSPSPSPSPSPAEHIVIEIGWVGDTTPGSKYGMPPDSGRALFASVREALRRPDLMIANLEGTYSTGGPSKCDGLSSSSCFAFQAPPAYAKALAWAGIDLVSVANNHSHDYLARGLEQTTAALDTAGVAYTGLPDQITVLDVKGVRVAAVAFSPYSWNPNINDIAAAGKLVRRAAERADVVVVLMHAGAEGSDKTHTPRGSEIAFGENRGDSRAFAHAVIDAGADLVLGSGPHVIRGIERYRDRLIAYSLGNFAGWGNFGLGGNLSLSGLLTIRIDGGGQIRGGRWLSLYLDRPGVPRTDTAHTAARLVRQLSAADFSQTYRLDAKGSFAAD